MPFIKKAGDANLTGYTCQVCDAEVGADQPIFADYDGEVGERPVALAWCAGCWVALEGARCETWQAAARVCAGLNQPRMAEMFAAVARGIALGVAHAKADAA